MELTVDYLLKKHAEFNKDYFDEQLSTPLIRIKTNRTYNGLYNMEGSISAITISDYYKRTERDFCNTLLHEMIHQLIREKKIRDNRSHGKVFYKYARFINQYGWNIKRCNSTEGYEVNDKYKTTYHLALFKDGYGRYFVMRYNPKSIGYFASYFAKHNDYYLDVQWFTSNDDVKFSHLPNCHSSVRGRFLTKDEYDKIRNTYIEQRAAG